MEWLVKEIQRDILDNKSITDILRKTLILYKKLNLNDIEFIKKELNWYKENDKIPDYRVVSWYRILWRNPYRGWVLANISNDDLFDKLVTKSIDEPISKIQELTNWCQIILPNEFMWKFMNVQTEYKVEIAGSEFSKIIEYVKNIILDRCIELEKNWILWEWISFTKEEIQKAENIINNFHWNISDSNIQTWSNSIQKNVTNNFSIEDINKLLSEINHIWDKIKEIPENELVLSNFKDIEDEVNKHSPNNKTILNKLISIKDILSWTSWNLIATWIVWLIEKIITN